MMENITSTLALESPYTATGEPRADLPTGEVLAWDGFEWCNGFLSLEKGKVILLDHTKDYIFLHTVKRFAPLPTIYEDDSN